MGTNIRPEVSVKRDYRIDKHRYYELRHFCLQYPLWEKAYKGLDGMSKRPDLTEVFAKSNIKGNPTEKCAAAKLSYARKMDMVKNAAKCASEELADYIFKGVTTGLSYDKLKARYDVPCGKELYYIYYRRFFWYLSKERD